jgi:hypothetical protein
MNASYLFSPAAQLTTTVIGVGAAGSDGARLKRKRLPSGAT